jgi:hypothetical protein
VLARIFAVLTWEKPKIAHRKIGVRGRPADQQQAVQGFPCLPATDRPESVAEAVEKGFASRQFSSDELPMPLRLPKAPVK